MMFVPAETVVHVTLLSELQTTMSSQVKSSRDESR